MSTVATVRHVLPPTGGTLGYRVRPTHGLVTPEAVVLDLPTASPGTRVLAHLLDVADHPGRVKLNALVVLVGTTGASWAGTGVSFIVAAFGSLIAVILVYPVLMEGRVGGQDAREGGAGAPRGADRWRSDRLGPSRPPAEHLGLVEVWGTLGSLGFIVHAVLRVVTNAWATWRHGRWSCGSVQAGLCDRSSYWSRRGASSW